MAEGVRKSFRRAIRDEVKRARDFCDIDAAGDIDFNVCTYSEGENPAAVESLTKVIGSEKLAAKIYRQACADVTEETHQAMEALIHNFNTLHSRAGAQVPFSSINYGMDTSPEGRLVIREVLNAIDAGLGNGETPIFPISVFQLKSGVNYNVDDPNYDLFRQACKVSAKRLFPNFVNIDAPYNLQYYKAGDYNSCVATMGCADGDEIILCRYKGSVYCEGLKRLWRRIDSEIFQQGLSEYKIPSELEVWDGENGFVEVKTVIKNPDVGNWTRIKFDNGRSLLVTADHPLYTESRGRIHVKDLQIGDTIKTYYAFPECQSDTSSIEENLAYALGLIITDGNYSRDICIALDGRTEADIEAKFIESVKKAWHSDCHVQNYNRGVKGCYDLIRVCGEQKKLSAYLKNLFGGELKAERSIPNEIFSSSREVRLTFLAGMIDGDKQRTCPSTISFSTVARLSCQTLS